MARGVNGRTIPLLGATPRATSRLGSSSLLSPLALDRLIIRWIAISPENYPHARNSKIAQ